MQPGLGVRPVLRNGSLGNLQHFGHFSNLHAAKEAKLDDLVRGDPATFGKVLTAAVEQAPEIRNACREYLVEKGRWKEAAAVCERLMNDSSSDADAVLEGIRAAAAYVQAGELDEYHRVCDQLVERFRATSIPEVAKRVAKACLIAPPHEATLNVANQLVELSMQDPNHCDGGLIP